LGADQVFDIDQDSQWKKHLPRLDIVIEATGRPEIWEEAVQLVRKGGTVNLFGGCPAGSKITLDTTRMHYDQITLKSSFHHRPSAIRTALQYIAEGVVKPKEFISDEKTLEDLPDLFKEMLVSKKVVKTCLVPA
jgi:L-iditol 2-dehydrogenase